MNFIEPTEFRITSNENISKDYGMKTKFEENTLGDAIMIAIKKDYENDRKANLKETVNGITICYDLLPFKGIEKINFGLLANWQYMNMPITYKSYSKTPKTFFDFKEGIEWRKYAPQELRNDDDGLHFWCTFEERTDPFEENAVISVEARGRLYTLAVYHNDYYIRSIKMPKFPMQCFD